MGRLACLVAVLAGLVLWPAGVRADPATAEAVAASDRDAPPPPAEPAPAPEIADALPPPPGAATRRLEATRPAPVEPSGAVWPRGFTLRVEGAWARLDWGRETFRDRNELIQMPGLALNLGRADMAGLEVNAEIRVHGPLRFGVGLGFYSPVGGPPSGELAAFGGEARPTGVHLVSWHGDFGFAKGWGDLTLLAMWHAGYQSTLIELSGDCDCPSVVRAKRWATGPRVTFRAHLHDLVFIHASYRTSILQRGDHQVTVGVGVGHREGS